MDLSAIYHRSTEQMCYMLNEEEVKIHIRTGMDVERVRLVYADPYVDAQADPNAKDLWGNYMEMTYEKELTHQKWWTAVVRPKWKRLKYHFELEGAGEKYVLFEEGLLLPYMTDFYGRYITDFVLPWMNPADLNRTPEWAADTVWYHIFPDRFFRGSGSKADPDIVSWREEGTVNNNERFGGNLKGITEKLEYLAHLGINGIYLMPIFESASVHHYETDNYFHIDPALGTDRDMERLVAKAHSLGMRVMMDAVFNHCGSGFAPWADVLKKGRKSRYRDWFFVNEWPIKGGSDTMDGRYYTFSFFGHMPKLNTGNEEVIAYFEKVCRTWIKKYDIDGIRMDAGNEVAHYFLQRLSRTIKKLRPDFYILNESWHDSMAWLMGDEFDAVTNYEFATIVGAFFMVKSFGKKDFEHGYNDCFVRYMDQTNRVLFNLLDSHDTNRLMTRTGSYDVFVQELTLLLTLPGSPCIYYGTEIALEGDYDPDCRRCMPWKKIESGEGRECFGMLRSLIRLRKEEKALRSLEYRFTKEYDEPRLLEYIRSDKKKNQIQVLLNASENAVKIRKSVGEVLFSNGFSDGVLHPGGTLLHRVSAEQIEI